MAGRLRILSANLWNGRADPDALAARIRDEAVDVACLQELGPEQAEAVASVLPEGQLEPAADHTGMGIALRYPATLGRLHLRRRPLRVARLDPLHWPNLSRPLHVWNAHVWAPHDSPLSGALALRRAQLRGLLRHLRREDPERLLLVGDFNATPLWPVYRRLAAELRDAALEVAQRRSERPPRTWAPWTGERRLRLLRIDHAFVRELSVEDVVRLPIAGSDHDALRVDLAVD